MTRPTKIALLINQHFLMPKLALALQGVGRVGLRAEARSPSARPMLRNGLSRASRQADHERVAGRAQNRAGLATSGHPPPWRAIGWPFRLLALSPLMEGRMACCGRCSRDVCPRRRRLHRGGSFRGFWWSASWPPVGRTLGAPRQTETPPSAGSQGTPDTPNPSPTATAIY